jgi:hypothetical protein
VGASGGLDGKAQVKRHHPHRAPVVSAQFGWEIGFGLNQLRKSVEKPFDGFWV